ncbi:PIWI [Sergentomyia squamirostris]
MSDKRTPMMPGRERRQERLQQQDPYASGSQRDRDRDPARRAGSSRMDPSTSGYSGDSSRTHPGGYGQSSGGRPPPPPPPTAGPSTSRNVSGDAGAVAKRGDPQARGSRRGNRAIQDIIVTRPPNVNTKKGQTGQMITVVTNYFKLLKKPEWNIYKYRVDIAPEIELLQARKAVMRRQIPNLGSFQFDGSMIFSPYKYAIDPMIIVEKNDADGSTIQITIRAVGQLLPTDGQYTQLLNLVMRSTIESLNMQRAYGPKGTKYFDPQQKIEIRQHNLQVWPGFSTSIRQHESDILICAEVTHKVIRMESCYKVMSELGRDIDSVKRALIGQMVVTEYNNATYRIDDVDFNLSPSSSFEKKSGERITFIQYFMERYRCSIRDTRQPLLVSRAKARDVRAGRAEIVNLVPELCRLTGLTDTQRADTRLMRDMAQSTRIGPDMRVKRFLDLNRRIQEEQRAQEMMKKWEMTLDRELVEFSGRVLPVEELRFGGDRREMPNDSADWGFVLKKNRLFQSQYLSNWHVICTERDFNTTTRFLGMLHGTAQRAGFDMPRPSIIRIRDDRSTSYVSSIEQACNDSTQIIMCVVPNQRGDRYTAIKQKSCVERAVPTQCMWTKVMCNDRILGGVVLKVMIQMSCKLGNAPWTVKIPMRRVMTVGFDVTFDANDKSKSYGAFVATMDLLETCTYFSTVSQHKHGEEMSNFLVVNLFKALKQFVSIHKDPPNRIIFYRDGVGDGDLSHIMEFEVKRLSEDLKKYYGEKAPKLTFIIVSKRINTRLFRKVNGNRIDNAPPGTVVDDVITLPERYDFFLVSQSTRQGTVSPTSYNVIWDESGLPADKIQIWTYKMTHLYYNWAGNVKVPMVCQYAQKLALLVGQHIHREPSHLLEKQLYFL